MPLKTKICGLSTAGNVEAVIAGGASFAGFVVHPPSPRNITPAHAATLRALLPADIHSVVVMVNPSDALLKEVVEVVSPAYLQLHGNETPQRVAEVKEQWEIPVIKALSVRQIEDLDAGLNYADSADMLLLDAPSNNPDMPGGTGHHFDWSLLAGRHISLPWFLSGGLNESNLFNAIHSTGAQMVDVSSGVESTRGVKDNDKIRAFLSMANTLGVA